MQKIAARGGSQGRGLPVAAIAGSPGDESCAKDVIVLCRLSLKLDVVATSRHAGSPLTRGAREHGLNKASGSVMGRKLTNLHAGPSPIQNSGIQHHRWQPPSAQGRRPEGRSPGPEGFLQLQ